MHHQLACTFVVTLAVMLAACDKPRDRIAERCAGFVEHGFISKADEAACTSSIEGYLAGAEREADILALEAFAGYERTRTGLEELFGHVDRADYPERDPSAIPAFFLEDDEIARDHRARLELPFSIVGLDETPARFVFNNVTFATGNIPQRFIDDLDWPCAILQGTDRPCRGEFLVDKMMDRNGFYEIGIVALRLEPVTVEDFRAALLESARIIFEWQRSPEGT